MSPVKSVTETDLINTACSGLCYNVDTCGIKNNKLSNRRDIAQLTSRSIVRCIRYFDVLNRLKADASVIVNVEISFNIK